jgi:hypothetical protein
MATRPRVPSPPPPSGPDTGGSPTDPTPPERDELEPQPGTVGPVGPGPGDIAPSPAPSPAAVEEAAQRERTERERLDRLEQQLQQRERDLAEMRAWKQQTEQAFRGPAPAPPDIDRLLFEQPAQTLQYITERTKAELRQEYQQVEAQRQQQQAMQDFERTFYEKNRDLVGLENVVKGVFQEAVAQGQILDLPITQAREELAKRARQEVLRIQRHGREVDIQREGQPVPRGRAVVEGGGAPVPGRSGRPGAPADDEGPESLSDIVRAKQDRLFRGGAGKRR